MQTVNYVFNKSKGEPDPGPSSAEEVAAATTSDDDTTAGAAAVGQQSSAMLLLLGDNYSACAPTNDSAAEVDNYMRDNPPELTTNPLQWWKTNQARFPRLAKLARRYLCIPGTSVPSERVFSAAGLTVNRLRTRLTPEHVDMLIFLNKNQ